MTQVSSPHRVPPACTLCLALCLFYSLQDVWPQRQALQGTGSEFKFRMAPPSPLAASAAFITRLSVYSWQAPGSVGTLCDLLSLQPGYQAIIDTFGDFTGSRGGGA